MYTFVTMYCVFAIKEINLKYKKGFIILITSKAQHLTLFQGVEKFWNFWREILRSYVRVRAVLTDYCHIQIWSTLAGCEELGRGFEPIKSKMKKYFEWLELVISSRPVVYREGTCLHSNIYSMSITTTYQEMINCCKKHLRFQGASARLKTVNS